MGLQAGELIDDKYRIVRMIGEGGMGAVYEGENTRIHRRVAIKVLHSGVSEMPEVVARFEREAQAAGRIGHEHIVEVLDLGNLSSGARYMVMEFMDGDSLSQRIRQRGSILPLDLYPIARQLLEALAAAHRAGIVHRDLKPDNVFLLRSRGGQKDFVKLLDFGISKFSGAPGTLSMTRTGVVMGTPYYMAPEQAKGARDIDQRVDVYAAGVILYEALAGRVPFLADTFNELLFKIVLEKPEPLANLAPHVDPTLAGIVARAMAREPVDRFQTADALRDALDAWAAQSSEQRAAPVVPPVQPLAVSTGAVAASSMLGSTPGSWAGVSVAEGVAPAKPKTPVGLLIGVAVTVLALGAGGVVMLTRGSHGPAATTSAGELAPPAPTTSPASATAAPAPVPAPTAVETAAAPAVNPLASSSATATPQAAPPPAAAAPKAVRRSAPASPSRPAAAAPTSPSRPAPKAPASPASGRKIRQSL